MTEDDFRAQIAVLNSRMDHFERELEKKASKEAHDNVKEDVVSLEKSRSTTIVAIFSLLAKAAFDFISGGQVK